MSLIQALTSLTLATCGQMNLMIPLLPGLSSIFSSPDRTLYFHYLRPSILMALVKSACAIKTPLERTRTLLVFIFDELQASWEMYRT
jgi:hypothetical protein